MEFKLKDFHYNTSDEGLLDDLRTAAYKLGRNNITSRDYDEIGKYTSGTFIADSKRGIKHYKEPD